MTIAPGGHARRLPEPERDGPAPKGETICKGSARFETASPPADRLDVAVSEGQGTVVLALTYGDRCLALTLTR